MRREINIYNIHKQHPWEPDYLKELQPSETPPFLTEPAKGSQRFSQIIEALEKKGFVIPEDLSTTDFLAAEVNASLRMLQILFPGLGDATLTEIDLGLSGAWKIDKAGVPANIDFRFKIVSNEQPSIYIGAIHMHNEYLRNNLYPPGLLTTCLKDTHDASWQSQPKLDETDLYNLQTREFTQQGNQWLGFIRQAIQQRPQ